MGRGRPQQVNRLHETRSAMTIIGALSVCLCGLLASFLLLVRGPLQSANRLLAGFLLLTAVDLAGWMAPLFPSAWQPFFLFRVPLGYLQMTMLYAYVGRLCFPAWRSRWNWIAGMLATIASAASFLPRATALADDVEGPGTWFDLTANDVALHLQFYVYIALMVGLLIGYRRERRTSGERETSLVVPWVGTVLGVSLFAHSLVLAKSWALIGGHVQAYATLQIVVGVVAVVIMGALTLTTMFLQALFVGMPTPPMMDTPRPSRADPVISDPAALAELRRYMTEEQPFLDPALTIRTLARRMGMGQRELSALLNQQLGLHFFDFVNGYRVDKAAALLAQEADRPTTVLDIAYQVGFNTKSSFNAAFIKLRGQTPTQHRARLRSTPASVSAAASDFAKSGASD